MNKTQEESLICVVLFPAGIIIGGALLVGLAYVEAMSFWLLALQLGAFAVYSGFFWFYPLFINKIRTKKKNVTFDERDRLILKRSVLVAYSVLWLYFVGACVIGWWVIGPRGSVSVNIMPLALIGGLALFTFVQHLATLIQYWLGGRDGKE